MQAGRSGESWLVAKSSKGGAQGAPLSSAEYCVTTHGPVRRLNAAVVDAGGVARFFSDNGFIGGLAQDVWPAIEQFDADLAALDLEFRLSASACYSPSGAYGARPDACPIGVLCDADGAELGRGLNVCNIPVGDAGYVHAYLSSKASDVVSQIRKISLGLRDFANEEWCALYYSSSHQWDYWATHALPRDSRAHSADVDAALLVAAKSATGVDFESDEVARRQPAAARAAPRRWRALARRDHGRRVLRRREPGGAALHRPHRRRGRGRGGLLPFSRLGARRGLVRPRQRRGALRDVPRERPRERVGVRRGVGCTNSWLNILVCQPDWDELGSLSSRVKR